jgi:hypothetical protein
MSVGPRAEYILFVCLGSLVGEFDVFKRVNLGKLLKRVTLIASLGMSLGAVSATAPMLGPMRDANRSARQAGVFPASEGRGRPMHRKVDAPKRVFGRNISSPFGVCTNLVLCHSDQFITNEPPYDLPSVLSYPEGGIRFDAENAGTKLLDDWERDVWSTEEA